MKKTIMYVGLDVPKNSIKVGCLSAFLEQNKLHNQEYSKYRN